MSFCDTKEKLAEARAISRCDGWIRENGGMPCPMRPTWKGPMNLCDVHIEEVAEGGELMLDYERIP